MTLTVRAKLAVLVGLPLALMGAAIPLLSTMLHRALVDAADDHVQDAQRAFEAEMEDDLADLRVAARVMAGSGKVRHALQTFDTSDALRAAEIFSQLYPRLDILLAHRDHRVLGDVGPTEAPETLDEVPEFVSLGTGPERQLVARAGCARNGTRALPSQVVIAPVESDGWVVACEPLDTGYLENASAKLDVELAFFDRHGTALAETKHFPKHALEEGRTRGTFLAESGGRTWAVERFLPALFRGTPELGLEVVAAVDISKTRRGVERNLYLSVGLLAAVAAVALLVGARMASVMSRALQQVLKAYGKLARQEYVRVPVLNTNDELELLATGFNQMVDGLVERDKLRTTFGKYMTESVLEHLLRGTIALGGETLRVTILFSDIRSFTTMSEHMEAHALVALLNEYFTEMVTIIMKNGGVVDKYIGDAIMAVFGAPVPKPSDAGNALRAAVEMRAALARLNDRLVARGRAPLRTGIGVHTGDVVAGNIGSEQRMEYTVVGDPVNVASRLESCTKELHVDVLISEATFLAAKDVVRARPVKELSVKGRAEPVMTYEVLGLAESSSQDRERSAREIRQE